MKDNAKCIWLNKKWVRSHGNHWCYFWNLLTSQRVLMSCHAIFYLIGQDLVNHKVVSSNPNTPNVIWEHRDCWANEILSRSPFLTPVPFCLDHLSWHQFPLCFWLHFHLSAFVFTCFTRVELLNWINCAWLLAFSVLPQFHTSCLVNLVSSELQDAFSILCLIVCYFNLPCLSLSWTISGYVSTFSVKLQPSKFESDSLSCISRYWEIWSRIYQPRSLPRSGSFDVTRRHMARYIAYHVVRYIAFSYKNSALHGGPCGAPCSV